VIGHADQQPRNQRAEDARRTGPVPWIRPYVQAQPRAVLHERTPLDPARFTLGTSGQPRTDPLPPLFRTPGRLQRAADALHRSILVVDIEGYSRPPQTNRTRGRLRDTLYLLLDKAIGSSGIRADQHEPPHDQGDGALLLFHPEVPKNRLLYPLIADLAETLTHHNPSVPPHERLRLRVVLHAGELVRDHHGWYGEDLDQAFHLVNSDTLRARLAETPRPLVFLITDQLYQGIVKQELAGIHPSTCQQLQATVKRGQVRAWLHIPR
jgi:hypothetical protein